jgi:predicted transcriptional regulator
MENRSEIITLRVSPQERRKLQLIAQRTQRPVSQVMRLLIAQAGVPEGPDVQLKPGIFDNCQSQPA